MMRKVSLLGAVALFTFVACLAFGSAAHAATGLVLERNVQFLQAVPGEALEIVLELYNGTEGRVEFTLIEEIPLELDVVHSGTGSYNRLAGFIVWTGVLEAGARQRFDYTATLTGDGGQSIPLYAYASARTGEMADSAAQLVRTPVEASVAFERTLVAPGDVTALVLRVANPLDRPLDLRLTWEGAGSLTWFAQLPDDLVLDAGEVWTYRAEVAQADPGTYTITMQPMVGATAAGPARRASLTVYADVDAAGGAAPEQELVVAAPMPDGARDVSGSARTGVVIVAPGHGQVITDRQHIDIEIEAPEGAEIVLEVNGQIVPRARLGLQGSDPLQGRYGERYIAIPIEPGENRIVAHAVLPGGERQTDATSVFRSGIPTQLTIGPLTPLATDRVEPLVFEIVVLDARGLPAPDGAVVTVSVEGANVASEDIRPDWKGHQQTLEGGRTLVLLEPPQEATLLAIEARVGDVVHRERFRVTAEASEWFVIGHGTVRAESRYPIGDGADLSAGLRLFARGPVAGDAVLTVAYDSDGLGSSEHDSKMWTGDGAGEGQIAAGPGPYHVRVERGLSYAQLGIDTVEFDGTLSSYTRPHTGLHFHWEELPTITVRAFHAREATDLAEEEFPGDGTRYYRLSRQHIEAFSEDVSLIVRDRFDPGHIVQIRRLPREAYRLDYRTGQLFLVEPVPLSDSDGNPVALRVRYRTVEADLRQTVQGVQALLHDRPGLLRATVLQTASPLQPDRSIVAWGYEGVLGGSAVELEMAASLSERGVGRALRFGWTSEDVAGWSLSFAHRIVDEKFVPLQATTEGESGSTFRADRRLNSAVKLSTVLSRTRETDAAANTYQAEVLTELAYGIIRPRVSLRGSWGGSAPFGLTVAGKVGAELRRGQVELVSEQRLAGEGPTRHMLSAKYQLSPQLTAYLDLVRGARNGDGSPESMASWGLSHTVSHAYGDVVLKGGYRRTQEQGGPGEALQYAMATDWTLNEAHTVEFGIEQLSPLAAGGAASHGTTLSWQYIDDMSASTLRLDRHTDGQRSKAAVQWHGVLWLNKSMGVRGEGLWTHDSVAGTRTRISLDGAYRTGPMVVLSGLAGERSDRAGSGQSSLEARIKGVVNLSDWVRVHGGYALRRTDLPTNTGKLSLGVSLALRPDLALIAEHSWLTQKETGTRYRGVAVGVGKRVVEDIWLTVGYAHTGYVGFDSQGDAFAKGRSGLFVELDVAFHERSLDMWFGRSMD